MLLYSPQAAACIVLCDKLALNPEEEDASNIMRVIAVKNYSPRWKQAVFRDWDRLWKSQGEILKKFSLGRI